MISIMRRYGVSLLNKEFSVKTVMMASLVAVAVLAAVGNVVVGPTLHYDSTTMGITLAICGCLLFMLFRGSEALFPMFSMLTTFFLLFIFTRVLTFLYFPTKSVLPLSVVLSVEQINAGYIYIAIGAVALGAGFSLGYTAFKKIISMSHSFTVPIKVYPPHHLAMVFAIVCVTQLYVALWLGAGVMGDVLYGVDHKFVGVLSVLFSSSQAFLVVVISMVGSRNQYEIKSWLFPMFMLFFLLVITLLGSRSGGLQVFAIMLVALLVIHGNFHMRLRNYFLFVFSIAVFSFALFPVATEGRTYMLAERDLRVVKEKPEKPEKIEKQVVIPAFGGGAFNRLGASFDTTVLTLALEADKEMLSRTMNLPYAFKSAINVIVPGEIYAEAHTNTAMLWPFIYKLRDQKLLNDEYYESFIWTAWGTSYSMFGWGVGIIALLIAGFILQIIYMVIIRQKSQWLPYFSAWLLLSTFTFFNNMGLDDWLVGMQRSLFSMLLVLFLLWGIEIFNQSKIVNRWKWD